MQPVPTLTCYSMRKAIEAFLTSIVYVLDVRECYYAIVNPYVNSYLFTYFSYCEICNYSTCKLSTIYIFFIIHEPSRSGLWTAVSFLRSVQPVIRQSDFYLQNGDLLRIKNRRSLNGCHMKSKSWRSNYFCLEIRQMQTSVS